MSSSNCCFLTCLEVSEKEGKVAWYSHLFKNFPKFVVIHRVKGFSIVSEEDVDVLLEFPCFSMIQWMLATWSLIPLWSHSVVFNSATRSEYWSGLLRPPPGDLPNPGIEPRSPALQADFLPAEAPGKPKNTGVGSLSLQWIFLTQESNWGLLHCRQVLYQLNYQGSLF